LNDTSKTSKDLKQKIETLDKHVKDSFRKTNDTLVEKVKDLN